MDHPSKIRIRTVLSQNDEFIVQRLRMNPAFFLYIHATVEIPKKSFRKISSTRSANASYVTIVLPPYP